MSAHALPPVRLMRAGAPSYEKPTLVGADGARHDVSILLSEVDGRLLESDWPSGLAALDRGALPPVDATLRAGAVLERPRRIIHVAAGLARPDPGFAPRLGLAGSLVAGACDPIVLPPAVPGLRAAAGVAAVIGGATASGLRPAGLCLFLRLAPGPDSGLGGSAADAAASSATLLSLGPFLVPADVAPPDGTVEIALAVNDVPAPACREPVAPDALARALGPVNRLTGLGTGDVVLFGAGRGRGPALRAGDRVTVRAGPLGVQERLCATA